jgi:hypothetical protein
MVDRDASTTRVYPSRTVPREGFSRLDDAVEVLSDPSASELGEAVRRALSRCVVP